MLITCTVWGLTWVVSKLAVKELNPLQVAAMRQTIAGGLLVAYFSFAKKVPLPTKKQFLWLLLLGVLMFVVSNGMSTVAVQYIPSGTAALISALYPLIVLILQRVFFGVKNFSPLTLVGVVLGFAGILLVFYENAFVGKSDHFFTGIGLSFLAITGWSFGSIFLARNKQEIHPYYGAGWQMVLSSIILWIAVFSSKSYVAMSAIPMPTWGYIFMLALGGSLLAYVAFIYSLKVLSPAIASLYAYVNPLIAMVAAAFMILEPLTAKMVWGAIVTLAGVFIVNYSIKKNQASAL